MFKHFGLYYNAQHIKHIHASAKRTPVKEALAALRDGAPPGDGLAAIQQQGFRFRLDDDAAAGERAGEALLATSFEAQSGYLDTVRWMLAVGQAFEQVRDHPALALAQKEAWLAAYFEQVNQLNRPAFDISFVEQLWLGALNTGAGVILEREDLFSAGVEQYRQVVDDEIRPEGYLLKAVGTPDGQTLYHQLMAVNALALTAEAAAQVGVDLWGHHNRGVSIITAAAYVVYYYYYPEKWRWDEPASLEVVQGLFGQHAGFLEMVNYRAGLKALMPVLAALRPIVDVFGGGMTTLTHALPAGRGLFG